MREHLGVEFEDKLQKLRNKTARRKGAGMRLCLGEKQKEKPKTKQRDGVILREAGIHPRSSCSLSKPSDRRGEG